MSEEFVRRHHRPGASTALDDSGDPLMTLEYRDWFDNLRRQDEKFSMHFYDLDIPQGGWGLVAGGGPGHNQRQMQHKSCHLVNADISHKALRLARAFSRDAAVATLHHVCADVQRLPFKDGVFDAALSMGVLHHVPDIDAAFSEVSRCCKVGADVRLGLYIRNILLHPWVFPLTQRLLASTGFKLPGRDFSKAKSPDDFVRIYDGDSNPIGVADTTRGWIRRLRAHFKIKRAEQRIFPYRALGRFSRLPDPCLRLVERLGGYMCCLWMHKAGS